MWSKTRKMKLALCCKVELQFMIENFAAVLTLPNWFQRWFDNWFRCHENKGGDLDKTLEEMVTCAILPLLSANGAENVSAASQQVTFQHRNRDVAKGKRQASASEEVSSMEQWRPTFSKTQTTAARRRRLPTRLPKTFKVSSNAVSETVDAIKPL